MSFAVSKSIGDSAEKRVSDLLKKWKISHKTSSDQSLGDIYLDELDMYIEIKNDFKSNVTPNFAIETHNTKKDEPSGIYGTKAVLWVQIIANEAYINLTRVLKFLCTTVEPKKKIEAAGDNNARILLYDKSKISYFFFPFDKESFDYLVQFLSSIKHD